MFHKIVFIWYQGGRSWQPFSVGENGHKNFRQARICYFRDKTVIFAHNCKFANLFQFNSQKVRKSQQILTLWQKAYVRDYNFRPNPNFLANALRAFVQLLPSYLIHTDTFSFLQNWIGWHFCFTFSWGGEHLKYSETHQRWIWLISKVQAYTPSTLFLLSGWPHEAQKGSTIPC